jgi:hypothetical protein
LTAEEDTKASDDKARPRASKKLFLAFRNLHTFYNLKMEKIANSEHAEFLFLSTRNQLKEPKDFKEAWFHNHPEETIGWKNAIENELNDMHLKHEV